MKYLVPVLALCLCAGCATRKPEKTEPVAAVPGTTIARNKMPSVRTPEIIKAYPAGRYSDPNYPDAMHERHTVYRREQSPDWNYLPDVPYTLPMGPVSARSNPSPSYYIQADSELMNAQQRAYAEALQEQNRTMKKRIEAMQEQAGKVPGLEQEIERLKKQLDTIPTPQPPAEPSQPEPAEATSDADDFFSEVEPPLPAWDNFTDPTGINVFARTDNEIQAFLVSQMRLNDELAAKFASAERSRITAFSRVPFLRRKELALLIKTIP